MFYGQMGGKDLVKRKWKGLAEFITLECDGKDLTPKLKELKVHAVVFLNIPRYIRFFCDFFYCGFFVVATVVVRIHGTDRWAPLNPALKMAS